MNRGKQQVLFNYLPQRTFDFEKFATIAKVDSIRGIQRNDLNESMVLRRIREVARAWDPNHRRLLRDDILNSVNNFILIDPQSVSSSLFPKVFWCQNKSCGKIYDYTTRNDLPSETCQECGSGHIVQLRFIKIHRCGDIQPLIPPRCPRCNTSRHMSLDDRGSEKISNFRWKCLRCSSPPIRIFAGQCNSCQWDNADQRSMDIQVHRAGSTYFAQNTVLLNIPDRTWDIFLRRSDWSLLVAAKYLKLDGYKDRPLITYTQSQETSNSSSKIGDSELDEVMKRIEEENLSAEAIKKLLEELRKKRSDSESSSTTNLSDTLLNLSGLNETVWQNAGYELFESLMPLEAGTHQSIQRGSESNLRNKLQQLNIEDISLISDFPILNATFGYSRVDSVPNECNLNPFPPMPEYNARYPIYIDQIQADAILIKLNPHAVLEWLRNNSITPQIPNGTNQSISEKAYFVNLFNDINLHETITSDHHEQRMVFGLLHTFSHLLIRHAALLCGLERQSLSEYLFPRALTIAIYSSHRFGATIGALTALFEQSLSEWLDSVRLNKKCIYDPVCHNTRGSCHACTHLPETSCRYFNLNLSRAFLFSAEDIQLGRIQHGFI